MKKITQEEFDEAVRKHYKFLNGEPDGVKLELKEVDLTSISFDSGKKLTGLNLSFSNFTKCDFSGVDLSVVNFSFSFLSYSNFSNSILHFTNFMGAYLKYANFANADMRYSPNFASSIGYQRIYQVSCGLGEEDEIDNFLDWYGENATLTLHVDVTNKKLELFINDFRGSIDEFIKMFDEKYIDNEKGRKQYLCAIEYLMNMYMSNDFKCRLFEKGYIK